MEDKVILHTRITALEEVQKKSLQDISKLDDRVRLLEAGKTDTEILKVKVNRIDNNVEQIKEELKNNKTNSLSKFWQIAMYVFTTLIGLGIGKIF